MKEGDWGVLKEDDRSGKPYRVKAKSGEGSGRTWWYDLEALQEYEGEIGEEEEKKEREKKEKKEKKEKGETEETEISPTEVCEPFSPLLSLLVFSHLFHIKPRNPNPFCTKVVNQ